MTNPKIFVAIDSNNLDDACYMVAQVAPVTGAIKLGLEFFNAFGPHGVEKICAVADGASLFLDLKFHDIPNTVAGAVRAICQNFAPAYLNVHASGGLEMMQRAKDACGAQTKLLGVTILTSLDQNAIDTIGYRGATGDAVLRLAQLTQQAGLGGVVCSSHEIEAVRGACGVDFDLVVPGIRPADSAAGDQKRIMTPERALAVGATHLVIGRPITQSDNPALAAETIMSAL